MLKVPTYISRLNKAIEEGDDSLRNYLLTLHEAILYEICSQRADIKFCSDNNFWRDRYLKMYYVTLRNSKDSDWKKLFTDRYHKEKRTDFSPLSNSQKIEVIKKYKFLPLDEISKKIKNTIHRSLLVKALIIYNGQPTPNIRDPTVNDIVDYYDMKESGLKDSQEIANYLLGFYTGTNKAADTVSFDDLYYNAVADHIKSILDKMDNIIKRETDVPDFKYSNISSNNIKRGIIFCHGKEHRSPVIPLSIAKENIQWKLVDISPASNPDIIGDYTSWSTIESLGLRSYDYIISHYCPIAGNIHNFVVFMRNMRWLLKNGGSLFILPGITVLHHNKDISNGIIDTLMKKYGYSRYVDSGKGGLEIIATK